MDLGLDGRVALVSGASRGIGRAAATQFAREGASVVLVGRTAETINDAVAALASVAPRGRDALLGLAADMADPAAVARVVAAATERFARVDIAVANITGFVDYHSRDGSPIGTLSGTPASALREEFRLSASSAWLLAHEVIPGMVERRWGRIVNVGSGVAREPLTEIPHILANTVRPAVAGMYRALAARLAPHGVTVNSVLTGSIATERNRSHFEWLASQRGITPEEAALPLTNRAAVKRFGKPEEMAAVIAFLCSERARAVTGQSIPVDGGINRHL